MIKISYVNDSTGQTAIIEVTESMLEGAVSVHMEFAPDLDDDTLRIDDHLIGKIIDIFKE